MRDLNDDLKRLGHRNKDGAYATQANRAHILSLIANELHTLGYKQLRAQDLKGRHVERLVQAWRARGLAPGTMKNRMAALRWWAEKVGKASVIARTNSHYGIPDRQYVATQSKAQTVPAAVLATVRDPHVRMSLEVQAAFGLRREEALKLRPCVADQGDVLALQASWTKGGKARTVPIRTDAQRAVLARAKALAGAGSLIPPHRSYIQQLKIYERHTADAGLSKLHGVRHAYAQERYRELTGRLAPAAGGTRSQALTPEEKAQDRTVRLQISHEMGHEREQITVVYLGR